MSILDKIRKKEATPEDEENVKGSFAEYPHLLKLKPQEGFYFCSDYFVIDNDYYGCIMNFFHDDGATDKFPAMWGVHRIPAGLPDGVTTVFLEQVSRRSEAWVETNLDRSDKIVSRSEEDAYSETTTSKNRQKISKIARDIQQVSQEINDGAGYLHVHNRLFVKAPSLETLDEAVAKLGRLFSDRLGTVTPEVYHGEQRQEFTNLFKRNATKRGKGMGFTTTEFAGSFSLVTHGLEDPKGQSIGVMTGDINNSGVLFDINGYKKRVVVADDARNPYLDRAAVVDMWGSKISQECLLDNGRVVHLILNGANLDKLGPRFDSFTSRVDMSAGDVNMFEIFGTVDDELSLFDSHIEKLVLMVEQSYEADSATRSIVRGQLHKLFVEFYVSNGMWAYNAKDNRDKIRLVGIPHKQVPRLRDFKNYVETEYKRVMKQEAGDASAIQGINILRGVFTSMLDSSGDLFNTHTRDSVDGARENNRVLYDFSSLLRRGQGVAMAQLVNILGFSVDSLGEGDTVIIHGAELIRKEVKEYISKQLRFLQSRGARSVILYGSVEDMLNDQDFNRFDDCDYTVLGTMSERTLDQYEKALMKAIPDQLKSILTDRNPGVNFIRREYTNVSFYRELSLGLGIRDVNSGLAFSASEAA